MRRAAPFLILFALVSRPAVAEAASLRVAPTALDLTSPTSAATLVLRNEGERPVHVQVRPFAWRQVDGADELQPTRELALDLALSRAWALRLAEAHRVAAPLVPKVQSLDRGAVAAALEAFAAATCEPELPAPADEPTSTAKK